MTASRCGEDLAAEHCPYALCEEVPQTSKDAETLNLLSVVFAGLLEDVAHAVIDQAVQNIKSNRDFLQTLDLAPCIGRG